MNLNKLTLKSQEAVQRAQKTALSYGNPAIEPETSSSCPDGGFARSDHFDSRTNLSGLKVLRGTQRIVDQNPEDKYRALECFGRDVNNLAPKEKLDPVKVRA